MYSPEVQMVSALQPRSEVCVGPADSYSSALHSEILLQILSLVDVAAVDSKSLKGSQIANFEHWRLEVAVGASDSYCHAALQDTIFWHSGAESTL